MKQRFYKYLDGSGIIDATVSIVETDDPMSYGAGLARLVRGRQI